MCDSIRFLGFSFHDSYDAFEEIINYRDWNFCQIQLNYMDIDEQAGNAGVALSEALNIPLVIMEPVKGGSLAVLPEDVTKPFRHLDPDASTASWALRFVGSRDNVKVVLSGMSTPEQLEDNLRTFETDEPLKEAEAAALLALASKMTKRTALPCTACRYCTSHCPQGLNIPWLLELYNEHLFTGGGFLAPMAMMSLPEDKKPSACIGCRSCEQVCPQQIRISEAMKDFCGKLAASDWP